MKRILLDKIPEIFPENIRAFAQSGRIFDSSCSPEARVYYIERDKGYYLKRATLGALRREALMNGYFHTKGLGPEVLDYLCYEGYDWLLCARVAGEDTTHSMYLSEPKRLAELLGSRLRALHETDLTDCPIKDRVGEYLASARANYLSGSYDKSAFPDSFGYRSAEEAYDVMNQGVSLLKSDTLIHGDYCLPNIMLDDWRFSGFIDLGNGGVGDRHIDLFWGAWSLWFNLGSDAYRDRFFDAYGRDKIDVTCLRTVAACEVFG